LAAGGKSAAPKADKSGPRVACRHEGAKRCRGRFQCEQAVNQAAHSKAEAARRCVSNLILRSREWDRESFLNLAKSSATTQPKPTANANDAHVSMLKGQKKTAQTTATRVMIEEVFMNG
jgi:hypothetical protein